MNIIRTIWLCDPRLNPSPEEAIPLRFPSYITTNDIQLLIQETFPHRTNSSEDHSIPIGLHDEAGRYYPLSMIKISPELFTKGVYFIVYLNDQSTALQWSPEPQNHVGRDVSPAEEGEEVPEIATDFPQSSENDNLSPIMNQSIHLPLRFLDGYFNLICQEIKYRTGLDNHKIATYLQALSQFSVTNDLITKGRFLSSMVFSLHQTSQQTSPSQFTPPIPPDVNAIFGEIFDIFVTEYSSYPSSTTKNSSNTVEIIRLCRFLSLFAGGLPNENVKILYHLYDYDQDGVVSFNDLYYCFHEMLLILSRLYDSVLDIMFTYSLDTIAMLLAQYVVMAGHKLKWENDFVVDNEDDEDNDRETYNPEFTYSGDETLSIQQFHEWYSNTEHILYLPPRSLRSSQTAQVSSFQHISAVKKALSFHPITCDTLKLTLQHFSENKAAFISSIGFFSSIILSFRIHQTDIFSLHHPTAVSDGNTPPLFENSHYLMTMETILRHVFDAFDPLHSEYVAVEDIFASLSLFLNASWYDRLTAYFQLNTSHHPRYQLYLEKSDTHLDPLLTEVAMIDYLVSILKTTSLFQSSGMPNSNDDDEYFIQHSTQLLQHALQTGLIPSQPHGCILLSDYALWLESNIDLGEPDMIPAASIPVIPVEASAPPPPTSYPLPSSQFSQIIHNDYEIVKEKLGFLGFTAEDFMDLLGESANAGKVTLSAWLHIVFLMNQLNATSSSIYAEESTSSPHQLSSSLTTLATNIFRTLSSLTMRSALSPHKSSRTLEAAMAMTQQDDDEKNTVPYHILLSTLIMLCDSPVEDKIAVIFTVLSETTDEPRAAQEDEDEEENKKVKISNLLFFIECVLSILSLISSTIHEIVTNTQQSTEMIAMATLQFAMRSAASEEGLKEGQKALSMDEFCSLFWIMLDGREGDVEDEWNE